MILSIQNSECGKKKIFLYILDQKVSVSRYRQLFGSPSLVIHLLIEFKPITINLKTALGLANEGDCFFHFSSD